MIIRRGKLKLNYSGLFLIAFTALLMVIPVSCSKYQDGPFMSFRSKSKRLAGTWKYYAIVYLDQNISVTDNLPETRYTYTEDGNLYTSAGDTGTWEFGDGVDLNLTLHRNPTDSLRTFEILRLANKELWLKTGEEEWHFEPE